MKYAFLFSLFLFIANCNTIYAQKKDAPKKDKPQKTKTVKPSKKNTTSATTARVSGMTRDDKNDLTHCPVTGKRMSLSDNYKANGQDISGTDEFPMAYQLGYRRYCKVCTRKLKKEQKKGTFSLETGGTETSTSGSTSSSTTTTNSTSQNDEKHCQVYDTVLLKNPKFDPNKEVSEINPETPNAKQYCKQKYCKTCTKIYNIQAKTNEETK